MGVCVYPSTMLGAVTPTCEVCGVKLCWDISDAEYEAAKPFWDAWKCQDCNGGKVMSLKKWLKTGGFKMAKKEFNETVIKELEPIRKGFKSRLLQDNDNGALALDVREYVESAKYTGWTKSGLRLNKEGLQKAIQVFTEALKVLEENEKKG